MGETGSAMQMKPWAACRVFNLAAALLAGCSSVCLQPAVALDPALDISQYAHTSWKLREGFSKGVINSVTQTSDGYLWLGSEFGLSRFDGVRNVPWDPPPGQHLPSNVILRLFTSRDGTLWIGTDKGLASWKNGKLTRIADLADLFIFALFEDQQGTVWAGGSAVPVGRLCAIGKGSTECFGKDGSLGRGVTSLYEYRGSLWVGSARGLWRWKPGPPELYPTSGPPADISSMVEGENGALWLSLGRGIKQLVDGKIKQYPSPIKDEPHAHRFLRDTDGGLWIASNQGLLHWHHGLVDTFTTGDGLSGDNIADLFEDREGTIWVATLDGLDRFRNFAVPTISMKQGLQNRLATSVLAAKDGSVWIGTISGLQKWTNGELTTYRRPEPQQPSRPPGQRPVREVGVRQLSDNNVESLAEDDDGRIWVSTRSGIGYLEEGRFTAISSADRALVRSIAIDRHGSLWIAELNRGLIHLSPSGKTQLMPWAKLGHNDFATRLAYDRQQDGLWVGFFNGGVAFLKEGRVAASYTRADGLGQRRINDFWISADNTLWIATDGGLSRLKGGRVSTLNSKSGLPCESVHWVIQDDTGSLWLHTTCGLVRVGRAELETWVGNPHYIVRSDLLDVSDGVMNRSWPHSFSPQVSKARDGKLWFLTLGGVAVFDPVRIASNKLAPPVQIEQITADHKQYNSVEGLKLPPLIRDLQIDYTALSLIAPEKVRFRYKLEGHDKDWQDAAARRQAFYNNLPPRDYRFRVVACNNNGVWNEAGAFLDFSIPPVYYQTSSFRLACVAGFLALLAIAYQVRLRNLRRQYSWRLEERVNERTRIARDLHDTLLQSLAGVSMQLHGISKLAATAPERTPSLIDRVREQVDSAFREARMKVYDLRSPTLEGNGLAAALREFTEQIEPHSSARFAVSIVGEARPCTPQVEEELLRIAQEAANNANRHAGAKEIRLVLEYQVNSLALRVSDDGCGFNLAEGFGKTGHWGLRNMQERAAQMKGKCTITSAPGSGTQVEVSIPLSSPSGRNTRAKHANSSTTG